MFMYTLVIPTNFLRRRAWPSAGRFVRVWLVLGRSLTRRALPPSSFQLLGSNHAIPLCLLPLAKPGC